MLKEDFKKILDSSFKYCESDDEDLAFVAREINAKAYQVMKTLERRGSNYPVTKCDSCNCAE